MSRAVLALTFEIDEQGRAAIGAELGGGVEVVSLTGLDDQARRATLGRATVLLSRNTGTELRPGEAELIRHVRLVQFLTAGVDFVPLRDLPPEVPVASNGGAYSEPMAGHALAVALAAAKRPFLQHAAPTPGGFHHVPPH